MPPDKRIVERDCCEIEAEIVAAITGTAVPCLITDISEDGARLELASSEERPMCFDLLLPIVADITDRCAVERRWQRG